MDSKQALEILRTPCVGWVKLEWMENGNGFNFQFRDTLLEAIQTVCRIARDSWLELQRERELLARANLEIQRLQPSSGFDVEMRLLREEVDHLNKIIEENRKRTREAEGSSIEYLKRATNAEDKVKDLAFENTNLKKQLEEANGRICALKANAEEDEFENERLQNSIHEKIKRIESLESLEKENILLKTDVILLQRQLDAERKIVRDVREAMKGRDE